MLIVEMKSMSDSRHRRSIRLKGYDYTLPGAYFVTLVTQRRECLFGEITGGEMHLNMAGEIARQEWFRTAELRDNVRLNPDEFVVMPNHVHGVIWIVEVDDIIGARLGARVGAQCRCAPTIMNATSHDRPNVPPHGLGAIVRAYKSAVTYRVNAMRETRGMPLWQRNYYEHIIRNEAELGRIQAYIQNNPIQWEADQLHLTAAPNPFNQ
jgi:REP-associated tyrosine transposase